MKDLIILMMSLFLAYASVIALYQVMAKTDTNTAKAVVDTAILKLLRFFIGLFSNDDQIQYSQYIPDEVLIRKLMESLAPYNELPIAYTEWQLCTYSKLKLPAIAIHIVCKNDENFPIIRNILNNVFKEHMAECGLQGFYNNICFQKLEESSYKLLLVYAVSDAEKENLKRLVMTKKRQAEIIAKNSVKPVVDDELERELEGNGGDFEE
jgi:hypothetical protein